MLLPARPAGLLRGTPASPSKGVGPKAWPVLPWVLRLGSRDGVLVLAWQSLATSGVSLRLANSGAPYSMPLKCRGC